MHDFFAIAPTHDQKTSMREGRRKVVLSARQIDIALQLEYLWIYFYEKITLLYADYWIFRCIQKEMALCLWWNVHCSKARLTKEKKLWETLFSFDWLSPKIVSSRVGKFFSFLERINWNRFLMLFQDEIKLIGITVKSLFSLIAVRARGAIKFNKTFPFFLLASDDDHLNF